MADHFHPQTATRPAVQMSASKGSPHAAVRPRIADTVDWQTAVEGAQQRGLPGFEDGVALLELLEALSDERREAFLLTQVVGLSYEEAAGFAGCPVGTVRSRVSRARVTLERLLAEAEAANVLAA